MFDNNLIVDYELNEVDSVEEFNNYYLTNYILEDLKNTDVVVKSNDDCFQIVSYIVEDDEDGNVKIYTIDRV